MPDNGNGKEDANHIRMTYEGKVRLLKSDAMEAEDCSFSRDLSWIIDALQESYDLGSKLID